MGGPWSLLWAELIMGRACHGPRCPGLNDQTKSINLVTIHAIGNELNCNLPSPYCLNYRDHSFVHILYKYIYNPFLGSAIIKNKADDISVYAVCIAVVYGHWYRHRIRRLLHRLL